MTNDEKLQILLSQEKTADEIRNMIDGLNDLLKKASRIGMKVDVRPRTMQTGVILSNTNYTALEAVIYAEITGNRS